MDAAVETRLEEIERSYDEVESQLGDPEVLADPTKLAELGKRHADMRDVVADIRRRRQVIVDLGEAKEMAEDPDMARMADDLRKELETLEKRIRIALVPTDPNDSKDVIVEIRSGVGGDEASLWA